MAAPIQKGVQFKVENAPTAAAFVIDADSYQRMRAFERMTVKNEATEDVTELFTNPNIAHTFDGTIKSGQARPEQGDLVTLTFPDTTTVIAVIAEPVAYKGFGKVIRGSFTVKKADSATY